jgi:hypothetical protein
MHFPQSKLFQTLLGVLCNSDQNGTKCENYMKDGLNGGREGEDVKHSLQTLWVLVLHLSSLYRSEYMGGCSQLLSCMDCKKIVLQVKFDPTAIKWWAEYLLSNSLVPSIEQLRHSTLF